MMELLSPQRQSPATVQMKPISAAWIQYLVLSAMIHLRTIGEHWNVDGVVNPEPHPSAQLLHIVQLTADKARIRPTTSRSTLPSLRTRILSDVEAFVLGS
ncbi:hypothetical protein CHARACLAT_020045 [Characodon lateralis]|uniref:Uncharacterized protein n=1 Tax=Characodon lateralis TaxID=208331 RepID=A0ABU7CZV2_9TELE|nr:hypothetical protein [Characodon lateralis]